MHQSIADYDIRTMTLSSLRRHEQRITGSGVQGKMLSRSLGVSIQIDGTEHDTLKNTEKQFVHFTDSFIVK